MIYTVTFNPALDYVMRVPKLVPDAVNRTDSEDIFYGGKGINVSIILSRLGVENQVLGFVAGFTGDEIEQGLKRQGIQTKFIHLPRGLSRINVKLKDAGKKAETDVNAQGPEIPEKCLNELFLQLDQLVEGDVLVLAGSIPKTLPSDVYEQIMCRLEHRKVEIVVDATKDLLRNVLKYHPFLIKPNNHELGEVFDKEISTKDEIVYYAKELQKLGARNVLVSMAGEGSILVTEQGQVHPMGVAKGTVKNSVGAGDSMVAGFVAGYMEKKDFAYALKLGTAAGGATAFSEDLASGEYIREIFATI